VVGGVGRGREDSGDVDRVAVAIADDIALVPLRSPPALAGSPTRLYELEGESGSPPKSSGPFGPMLSATMLLSRMAGAPRSAGCGSMPESHKPPLAPAELAVLPAMVESVIVSAPAKANMPPPEVAVLSAMVLSATCSEPEDTAIPPPAEALPPAARLSATVLPMTVSLPRKKNTPPPYAAELPATVLLMIVAGPKPLPKPPA
jgi:hypothetical protein